MIASVITIVLPRFIFLKTDPATYILLKQRVRDHVQELTHLIESALHHPWRGMTFAGLFDTLSGLFGVSKNQNEIVKALV